MELKDPTAGLILRALADAWLLLDDHSDDSVISRLPPSAYFGRGWAKCSGYCGKTLSEELDKLNVPHLQEESK